MVEQNKMERDNLGDKSIIDEDSSSSSSGSNHFEVDIRENDAALLELAESPSMMITLPQTYDFNTLNGSPKQSPPVQVMGQPTSDGFNRSPSPLFGLKHRSNSDWSLSSGESLFSIHTGNNSFTLDNGYFISKSGEFNWVDDHSCSTPDGNKSPTLPTVIDTSAENESGEKEDITETQNVSPIGSANSAKNSRLSDASCQSTNSFAFPVLAEGSPSRTKAEAENPEAAPSTPPAEAAPSTPPAEAAQTTPKAASTAPKAGGNQWFHCFSCFPMCC